jgi:hypothetical protein
MNFAELQKAIAAQETLVKSLSAAQVDAKGNAAVTAGAGKTNAESEEEEDDGTGNGDLGDGSPMVKSFKLVLEDGTEVEATDGSEMIKALAGELNAVKGAYSGHVEEMAKSFEAVVGLVGTLTEGLKQTREDVLSLAKRGDELMQQNSLLTKSLGAIGDKGRGMRSVTLGARPDLGGTGAAGPKHTASEILAKAEGALTANQITATEAVRIQTAVNMGTLPEQAILDRLFK